MKLFRIVAGLLIAVLAGGCAVQAPAPVPPETVPEPALVRVKPGHVPVFFDDMAFDGLANAIDQSLIYLKRLPPEREFAFGPDRYSAPHMIRSLAVFKDFLDNRPTARELTSFLRDRYIVYRSSGSDGSGRVLFTGYYEPFLQGSLKRTETYRYPVYGMPQDLVQIDLSLFNPKYNGERITARIENRQVLPYFDRADISFENRLQDKAEILAWVDNRVDLFFLQIQGSGRIFLENGGTLNVHYRASNGHPYRSIGRLLIEEGQIDPSRMSMQKIRQYLQEHPEEMRRILTHNPSYIFFQIVEEGPTGALGVELTPGRSIAIDRRLFPDAALAFAESKKPLIDGSGGIAAWTDLHRFVLSQDTGGAIRGPGRADLFWGNGRYAELAAGHMQHPGRLFFFVLSEEYVSLKSISR
ncbi:MAG: MltA domain-containing protein [Desulfobacterales bacterium]|nr:MltA domain-containing protein [Desulfobacterales bacterium]